MNIQNLPIEVSQILLQHVCSALRLKHAMGLRLVSKLFASEIFDAVVMSGAMNETTGDMLAYCTGSHAKQLLIDRCADESLRARYLYLRAQRQPRVCNAKLDFVNNLMERLDFIHNNVEHGPKNGLAVEQLGVRTLIDFLRTVTTMFVEKSRNKYNHDTIFQKLCDVVVQIHDLSRACIDIWAYEDFPRNLGCSLDQVCLDVACALGDLDLVLALTAEDGIRVDPVEPTHFLSQPIRAAVRGGHIAIVDYLLQCGSQTEARLPRAYEWTIIHDAVMNSKPAMLAHLLSQDLDFPLRRGYGYDCDRSAYEDALIIAAYQDNEAAFNMLLAITHVKAPLSLSLQEMVLFAACEGQSLSIATAIFDMNPSLDPNFDFKGFDKIGGIIVSYEFLRNCPLETAAYWVGMPLLELLLEHGADPNWSPVEHWYHRIRGFPLYRAASRGFDKCKDRLLHAGTDPAVLESLDQ